MNWSKGMLRLWIVVSLCWVLFVGAVSDPMGAWEDRKRARKEIVAAQLLSPRTEIEVQKQTLLLNQSELRVEWAEDDLVGAGLAALLPPLALLIFGALLRWALLGFKRT